MSDGVMKSINNRTEVGSFGLHFKIVYVELTFVQKYMKVMKETRGYLDNVCQVQYEFA